MTKEEYAVTCYKDGKIALEVRTPWRSKANLLAVIYAKSGEYDKVVKRGPRSMMIHTLENGELHTEFKEVRK